MNLNDLSEPIVQAPMAGGPSTPALAAAVNAAGGLGFLAAGYKTADALRRDIVATRRLTDAPIGVNVFVAPARQADPRAVQEYAARLRDEAERYGVALGEPRSDDDDWQAKLDLVVAEPVDVVSFTFGCPSPEVVARLHTAGRDVWVTVTSPAEARVARSVGADALVVQGFEAGGHRGSFVEGPDGEDLGLLALLRLVGVECELPLVASGAIADGAAVAAVLCAGAAAAQLGSAFMLTPEAGTSAPHRGRLATPAPTRSTRAFSGRQGRGIVNRFLVEHGERAPAAYPEIHYLTAPIRAAARKAGDPEAINLWAGQAHALAQAMPAADIVRAIGADARAALRRASARLG